MLEMLWKPTDPENTRWFDFLKFVQDSFSKPVLEPNSLYEHSVAEPEVFWRELLRFSGLPISLPEGSRVRILGKSFSDCQWFPDSKLNFAECLLSHGREEDQALLYRDEIRNTISYTFGDLRKEVFRLQKILQNRGIGKGDVVVGLFPNHPFSTISMLAVTSLGGIWASASPDFGTKGILDRFLQTKPKLFLTIDRVTFKGKPISLAEKIIEVHSALSNLKDYLGCIVFEFQKEYRRDSFPNLMDFAEDILPSLPLGSFSLFYESIRFQDPVYILFSSGTTGLPKCIVQGPGVLLNHWKEHALHCDIRDSDRLFYYTTCGWMMWNWTQSALSLGATICQYEGNPLFPDWKTLWKYAEEDFFSIFGTSAKYLSVLEKEGGVPKDSFLLKNLRMILSTGSPLGKSGFSYVYEKIKANVHLASISGGTDLNGCFALGNPTLPVHSGEIQCRGLGLAVEVWNEEGKAVIGEKGELVCTAPFPSMPLFFGNDPEGVKYRSAYFEKYPNIWWHGDFAELLENGGMVIYGRSDTTLNPGGVRIGTADIYSSLEDLAFVQDSLVIGWDSEEDVIVILFVVLQEGSSFNSVIESNIKKTIRDKASPRHVPSRIFPVPEIPYTASGKKVELAVKQILKGEIVKNRNALANPGALDYFEAHKREFIG